MITHCLDKVQLLYLFALQIVNSFDDSRQEKPDPDVQVSLELVSVGSLVEEGSNQFRLGEVTRGDREGCADPTKLFEEIVFVTRRTENENRLFRRARTSVDLSQTLVRSYFRHRNFILLFRGGFLWSRTFENIYKKYFFFICFVF